MFTDPNNPFKAFPKLKGRGAEIKHLVPALLFAWKEFMTLEDPMHVAVRVGLEMSSQIDQVLESAVDCYKLEGPMLDAYQGAIFVFLAVQNQLCVHWCSRGVKLFNITFKSHILAHSAFQAAYYNPRLGWTFRGEDFMQVMKRIAASSSFGTPLRKRAYNTMEKYSRGMWFQMCPADNWWR